MRRLETALLVVALATGPALAQPGKGGPKGGPPPKVDQNVGTNGNGKGFGTINKGSTGAMFGGMKIGPVNKGPTTPPPGSTTVAKGSGSLFGTSIAGTVTKGPNGTLTAVVTIGGMTFNVSGSKPSGSSQPVSQGPSSTTSATSAAATAAATAPTTTANTQPVAQQQPPNPNTNSPTSPVAPTSTAPVDEPLLATTTTTNGIDPIDPQDPPPAPGPDPIPPPEVAFAEPTEVDDPITPPEFVDLLFNQPKNIRLQLTVPRYGYFKGLVYSKGFVRLIGQIRVIGGVVAAGDDSAVALMQGAMATSNPDAFNNRVRPPVQRMRIVEWKETGN